MKIECKICKKEFSLITISHLAKHGISSLEEYRKRFPGAGIFSEGYKNKRRELARKQFSEKWKKDYFGMYRLVHSKKVIEERRASLIKTNKNKREK